MSYISKNPDPVQIDMVSLVQTQRDHILKRGVIDPDHSVLYIYNSGSGSDWHGQPCPCRVGSYPQMQFYESGSFIFSISEILFKMIISVL